MKTLTIQINKRHEELCRHPLYSSVKGIDDVRILMKWHAFAVWDFMSLLKSLQREVTCVQVPWIPSKYDKSVTRFINEIVLGEESDEDVGGGYTDHFSMYTNAMKEIGADTAPIHSFLEARSFAGIPPAVASFTEFNLNLVAENNPVKVASAFFYGRENLIPGLFAPLVEALEENSIEAPRFKHYLERHIELDGGEHGDLAQKLLEELCNTEEKAQEALDVALKSLALRSQLWDYILGEFNPRTQFAAVDECVAA